MAMVKDFPKHYKRHYHLNGTIGKKIPPTMEGFIRYIWQVLQMVSLLPKPKSLFPWGLP